MRGTTRWNGSFAGIRMRRCGWSRTESPITTPADGWGPGSRIWRLMKEEFKFMTTTNTNPENELTIVIPAKNEVKLIPRLLISLMNQDYARMSSTRVLVADARS